MGIPLYRPLELMQNEKITKFEFDQFIGVWDKFVPKPLCDEVIKYFDDMFEKNGCYIPPKEGAINAPSMGEGMYRSQDLYGGSLNRKDYSFLLNYADGEISQKINSCLKSCVMHYIEQYPQLQQASLLSTDLKIQKTPPEGGYHLWHYENANMSHAMREIVWMIYLNDMPDGDGATEFMYQRKRITPKAGTVVIWPAGFTHTHKGNTVFSQDKYILTGWYVKTS